MLNWTKSSALLIQVKRYVNGYAIVTISPKIKAKQFSKLMAEAASCRRCTAMCQRAAVLSELNGLLTARIMFIGEAPGRKGADQTRVPFSGDQSGKNFDRFLASINLQRQDIFITSAALCNPRSESGANRKPNKIELKNCSEFLQRTFELIDPTIVITLGSVALEAIKTIHPHDLSLKESAAQIYELERTGCWYRFIIPARRCWPRTGAKRSSFRTIR